MPFLTFPIDQSGVLIDLYVALSSPRIDVLKASGMSYPTPVKARAMIDTGAAVSSISPGIATHLGLVPSGKMAICSATTGSGSQECNLYDVCLAFMYPSVKVLGVNIPVVELDLSTIGIDALLGRDMLCQCLCIYDGQRASFTMAF
jgi:hypothetical protein